MVTVIVGKLTSLHLSQKQFLKQFVYASVCIITLTETIFRHHHCTWSALGLSQCLCII